MAYQPVPVQTFGGLNLMADPTDVSPSEFVTGKNFETADPGRVRARDGYTQYQTYPAVTTLRRFGQYVYASISNASYQVNTHTGIGGTMATGAVTDRSWDFAANGLTGYVYSAHPSRGLRRADPSVGTLGSVLSSTPSGTLLATTPVSDRLVCASQTSHAARVSFSAPGDGSSWGANDYVDLTPGDGLGPTALATYGNDLFVFKPDKFFVFSGESTDSVGGAVFNYRTVDTGKGAAFLKAAVGTPYGVFFVANDGLYVTTGGEPTRVSDAVAPLFDSSMASDFDYALPAMASLTPVYLAYHQNRIVVNFGSSDTRTLVYDPRSQAWLYWQFADDMAAILGDVPLTDSPVAGVSGQSQLLLGGATHLWLMSGSQTDDNGTAITSRVVSGSTDFGLDGYKAIREVELRGSGAVRFALSVDRAYHPNGPSTSAVTFNASHRGMSRTAVKGERFAWSVSGTAAWSLDSLTLHLRDRRAAGVGDTTA